MKITAIYFLAVCLIFAACKKQNNNAANKISQLYPLAHGNVWIYVDSFFADDSKYLGLDTFKLKTANPIKFNNSSYTPVTDQFDDSIFTIHSTDSVVHLLKQNNEALIFSLPVNTSQQVITKSYQNNLVATSLFTQLNTTTNYPSYKILVTQDDGFGSDYNQQELFFSLGIGIIKGRDIKINSSGNFYTYDSFRLLAYNVY